jgi:hypothetical protein
MKMAITTPEGTGTATVSSFDYATDSPPTDRPILSRSNDGLYLGEATLNSLDPDDSSLPPMTQVEPTHGDYHVSTGTLCERGSDIEPARQSLPETLGTSNLQPPVVGISSHGESVVDPELQNPVAGSTRTTFTGDSHLSTGATSRLAARDLKIHVDMTSMMVLSSAKRPLNN